MFIDKIQKTNQELLDVAFAFQQNGQILPDSYVIDMDILLDNAAKLFWNIIRCFVLYMRWRKTE